MSRHIKPHRWADAMAGHVADSERAAMERHAQSCRACARARDRVCRASDTFPVIREQEGPDLSWDSVRARVHWSVSKERRDQRGGPPRRKVPALAWAALAVTAAGALAAITGTAQLGAPEVAPDSIARTLPQPSLELAPIKTVPPKALAGLINRLSAGDVMIDGARPAELFGQRIVAGTVIATGDGRLDVQFGDASAFALGPHSTLDVRRFDAEAIELVVDGTIDIEVAPRAPGQRFVVLAGEHAIEVRGTQFRVSHDSTSTTVACRHGLVAVHDNGQATALVGTARRVRLATGGTVDDSRVVALSVDELTSLAAATPMTLPVWNAGALLASSAPLEVMAAGRREIRVDGIELGVAPLHVRVMPGRHTVEATDSAGRYRRAGWIDVAAPSAGSKPARLEVAPEPVPGAAGTGVAERRRQLRSGIDQAGLARCTRSIAKAGLTGTYVQIELSVDATGAVGFLNVLDTDLPSATASCVREVLADVRFKAGAAATWREKLDL